MKLNGRELAAVLTGLRMVQNALGEGGDAIDEDLQQVLNDAGKPLSDAEIDALCERLNAEPAPILSAHDPLMDAVASLAAAASAYRTYAKRHTFVGRAETDAFFTTRIKDMDRAVERGRAALNRRSE